jgi:hypothetical protein
VPTANIPIDDFVCNGVPTSGSNIVSNISSSVVVTYMTNLHYERAYIKK